MAKGDSVTVHLRNVAQPLEIHASRAGRRLVVTKGARWFTVDEITRTNKKVGNVLQIAAADLVAFVEHKSEYRAPSQKGKPVAGQVGLMESLEAGEPTLAVDAPEPKAFVMHDPGPIVDEIMSMPHEQIDDVVLVDEEEPVWREPANLMDEAIEALHAPVVVPEEPPELAALLDADETVD